MTCKDLVFMCMDVACMYVCMCIVCALLVPCRGQKRELDPLELELHVLVRHCVGAENLTLVLRESNKCC